MLRQALALAPALLVASCEILAPLDGLSGGNPATGGLDATTDTGVTTDGAPAGDAAADARSEGGGDAAPEATPPSCDAGLTACAGSCVDTQTKGTDCGRCGHSCGGGSCLAGVCQPMTLATAQDVPRDLVVAGSNVYFTTHNASGYVASCATTGCGPSPTVLTSGVALGSGITVAGSSLFFNAVGNNQADGGVAGNGTFACTTAGCGMPTKLYPTPSIPVGITNDGSLVYWSDSSLGAVFSCALGGCNGKPTVVVSGLNSPWYGLAVDAGRTFVYWTDRGVGNVQRCDLPGCAGGVQFLATMLLGPFDLALDATDVYFTDYGPGTPTNPGTVQGCAISGCANGSIVFSTQEMMPSGIAVDGQNVYWANNGGGTVSSCSKTGCPASGPTQLATGQSGPFKVALDTDFVYWTNTNGGTVMRVAKP